MKIDGAAKKECKGKEGLRGTWGLIRLDCTAQVMRVCTRFSAKLEDCGATAAEKWCGQIWGVENKPGGTALDFFKF